MGKESGHIDESGKPSKSQAFERIDPSSQQSNQNQAAEMSKEQREQHREDRRLQQTAEAFLDIMWSRVEDKIKDDEI